MCTAITYNTKNSYFGRNLDLEYSYDEMITITPRNYRFDLRHHKSINEHFAIIGMAFVVDDYPTGVMTNNPTFDMQLFNLNNYMHISTEPAKNTFAKDLDLDAYSRGMGGIGLPGDLSSASLHYQNITSLSSCGDKNMV